MVQSHHTSWLTECPPLERKDDKGVSLVVRQFCDLFIEISAFFDSPCAEFDRMALAVAKLQTAGPSAFKVEVFEIFAASASCLDTTSGLTRITRTLGSRSRFKKG